MDVSAFNLSFIAIVGVLMILILASMFVLMGQQYLIHRSLGPLFIRGDETKQCWDRWPAPSKV